MKNQPTWKNTLSQQDVWYGHVCNMQTAAKKVGYQYFCFNGVVWETETGERTNYTKNDLDYYTFGEEY